MSPRNVRQHDVPEGRHVQACGKGRKLPPRSRQGRAFEVKFRTGTRRSGRALRTGLRGWQAKQATPSAPKNPDVRIRAVRPSAAQFAKLRTIATSTTARQVRSVRMTQDQFLGTLYTALTTYEYVKLEAE